MSHGLLTGKSVLVTAAAGAGIGLATARRCAEEGARVVISDIHERRLAEAAEELGAHAIRANVTDEDDVQRLLAEAIEVCGGLDVLVNNAGLGGEVELTEMTDEQWFSVLDVTLTGTMRMTRAALRHMCPRRTGTIVNIASVSGVRPSPATLAYGAAKAGLLNATKTMAVEFAPRVRVNAVVVGLVVTEQAHLFYGDEAGIAAVG
ncbi:MAG: SDR family NAD(P)-dependent oxidoreductase, partial [Actinomycetota bacterium]